jgi:O-acetyl-ADP-ribose deacetylase (regulator of RNase III)
MTAAGNLRAKHIIHAVGPRFQEPDLERKLQITIRNILQLADDKKLSTLAFPAMGAGFYGVPLDTCARVMFDVITHYLDGQTNIREVIICLNDSREYRPFEAGLNSLASSLNPDPVRRSEAEA